MREKRKIPKKGKPKFAIIVDGETEQWYIQMLRRNERLISVDLKPEIPQKKKLKDQYQQAEELARIYDKVYWIIDFDTITKETSEAKKGTNTPLQELSGYCDEIEKKYENIMIVVINNPCFEYWILLHYEATSKYYASYTDLIKPLKKHLPDYEKTRNYYTKQNNDIYLRLKPHVSNAISNARKLSALDFENPNRGISQMHLLFDELKLKEGQ